MAPFLNAAALASQFPSLFVVNNSKPLTALYFAASWCPDCNLPTPILKQVLANTVDDWSVVYVASDSNEAQAQAFCGDSAFQQIPFSNVAERSNLKRHFGACAAKELALLGMTPTERKFGVPTLIVLETATGRIISTDGVTEIMTQKEEAVKNWKQKQQSLSTVVSSIREEGK